jgi:O-antigen/teichoic acid export membrane protein
LKERIKNILPPPVLNYFTKGATRSVRVKKNAALSLAIRCLNIAISFLLVPLTINYVNPTEYGIWLTLSSIVAWFSFFDIGFGNGLRNKFAEAVALGKHKLARVYVSTTYAVLTIVISIVLLLFFLLNPFLDWTKILNTPRSMERELAILTLIVFVFFCVQFILQLVNIVLTANQEPAKAALFKFYSNLLSLIIIFVLTKTTSGNLIYLGAALGFTPILVLLIASFWVFRGRYKAYSPSLKLVDLRFAKNLMHLGVKFFVIQVAGVVLYSTHNIIIAQLFGPEDVTPYNLAYKYFSTVTIIFSIILTPFWSAITEAYTKGDLPWIQKSMSATLKLAFAFIALIIFMVVLSDQVFYLWVGDKVKVPMLLSIVMGVYFCFNLLLQPYTFFINGTGKIKLQLIQSVITALINIPLAITLAKIPGLGISGLVIAMIICYLPGFVLTPIQYKKILQGKARGVWNQ